MRTSINDPSVQPCGSILVVDDEEFNRQLLHDPLEAQGHTVFEAASGEQALQLLQTQLPDVVLLDVMMPAMDGFQVCRKLKANPATACIPVIMITALTERKERLMGIQCGASDFLAKPIDLTEVILRVRNVISTRRLYDELQNSFQRHKELETLRDKLVHMIMRELRFPVRDIAQHLKPLCATASSRLPAEDVATLEKVSLLVQDLDAKLESAAEFSRKAA